MRGEIEPTWGNIEKNTRKLRKTQNSSLDTGPLVAIQIDLDLSRYRLEKLKISVWVEGTIGSHLDWSRSIQM